MEHMDAQAVFHMGRRTAALGLIVSEGARELGEKVNGHLVRMAANSPEEKENSEIARLRANARASPPATARA